MELITFGNLRFEDEGSARLIVSRLLAGERLTTNELRPVDAALATMMGWEWVTQGQWSFLARPSELERMRDRPAYWQMGQHGVPTHFETLPHYLLSADAWAAVEKWAIDQGWEMSYTYYNQTWHVFWNDPADKVYGDQIIHTDRLVAGAAALFALLLEKRAVGWFSGVDPGETCQPS